MNTEPDVDLVLGVDVLPPASIFLSTTAAWMKNWPQGVSVVPTAAMTVNSQRLSIWACGSAAPRAAPAPVRAGQDARDDVGDEHEPEHEQDALDLAVASRA